jgi:hypothetical protein
MVNYKTIKYVLLFIISWIFIGCSFINFRTPLETDSDKTKSAISSINKMSWIIIIMSVIVVLFCSVYFFTTFKLEKPFEGKIITVFDKFLLYVYPIFMLVIIIIQKSYVSSILPDMTNKDAVFDFNKKHAVTASYINGNMNFLLIMSIILLIMSGLYLYFKVDDDINIEKETLYDKTVKAYKDQLHKLEKEFDESKKVASESWIQEKENEIETYKLIILELTRKHFEQVKQRETAFAQNLKSTKEALDRAREIDVETHMAKGSLDIETVIPTHIKSNPNAESLTTRKIVMSKAPQQYKPSVTSSPPFTTTTTSTPPFTRTVTSTPPISLANPAAAASTTVTNPPVSLATPAAAVASTTVTNPPVSLATPTAAAYTTY